MRPLLPRALGVLVPYWLLFKKFKKFKTLRHTEREEEKGEEDEETLKQELKSPLG